jgi:hypothetical protein
MRSPTTAILWEVWARNRWPLVIALALLPMSLLLIAMADRLSPVRTFENPAPGFWVFSALFVFIAALMSLACVFWSFSFTAVDERGRFAGFPLRLFTMPVRTWRAVAVPLFSGLIAILSVYLAWFYCITRLMVGPRLPAGETLPDGKVLAWQLIVIATAYVCVQALIWLLYPIRNLRVLVLAVVAVAFLCLWMVIPELQLSRHPVPWFSGMAALFVIAVAAAFKVVDWDRRGGWQGTREWRRSRAGDEARAPFRSAAWAQLWFEWRRKGWFAAVVIGCLMGLSLLLWPVPPFLAGESGALEAGVRLEPFQLVVFWLLPLFAIATTTSVATGFGKPDFWLPEIVLPSFHATRPVSTARLVFAKMRAGAIVVSIAWLVFLLFITGIVIRAQLKPEASSFWMSLAPSHPALWKWLTHPAVILAMIAVQWHVFVGGMCSTLAGTRRHIFLHGCGAIGRATAISSIAIWCYTHPWDVEFWLIFLPFLAVALVIWKLWWAWISFRRAVPLLTRGQLQNLLGLWVVICVLIAAAAWIADELNAMPREIIWFFAAWGMPSGEMAKCVLHLNLNRHR